MKIIFLPKFQRQFNKLPEFIQGLALSKEAIFRRDPFHPSLKTHKLKGELSGRWSFRINYDYRIVFKFVSQDTIRFYKIGNHDIYD